MLNQELDNYMVQIAKGSMPALSAIYNEFSGTVYGLALSILREKEGARDVMQETFLRVMSSAKVYRTDLNGKAWLFSIARNLAISKIRKGRNEFTTDPEDVITADLPEEQQLDETVIRSIILRNALNNLDGTEAQIVILHVVGGLKHKEIGRMLNLSVGTVCSKYFYSLKKLRRFME